MRWPWSAKKGIEDVQYHICRGTLTKKHMRKKIRNGKICPICHRYTT